MYYYFYFQVLQDMVPPKKHLLRHQPANAQIGLMEGNTFCTTLQPRLFTMDLNVMEHKVFYTEVCNMQKLLTLIKFTSSNCCLNFFFSCLMLVFFFLPDPDLCLSLSQAVEPV